MLPGKDQTFLKRVIAFPITMTQSGLQTVAVSSPCSRLANCTKLCVWVLAVQPISHRRPNEEVHSSFKSLAGLQPLSSFIQDRKAHVPADTLHRDFFFHYCGNIPLVAVQIFKNAIILHRVLTALSTHPTFCLFVWFGFIFTQLLQNFILKNILKIRLDVLYCFTCNKEVHSFSSCRYLKSWTFIIMTEP